MPLALFKRDVLASTKPTDGRSAGSTLLGIQITKTVQAVGKVITRCEALASQLLLAASAQKAVLMPWLFMVSHSSSGDGLFAVHTLHGKLLLVAWHTVVVVVLGDKTLGTNGLLATFAGKAGLMPAIAFMLHLPGARHNGFLTLVALRGVLIRVALSTQELLILGGERFIH